MKTIKNRALFLLIVWILFVSNVTPVSAAKGYSNFTVKKAYTGFRDVNANAWYLPGVRFAFEQGLMKGISSENFNPDDQLSFAEAITLAVRVYEIYYNTVITPASPSNPWYQKYVDIALKYKILSGKLANYNAPITREEFTSLFVRLLPYENSEVINRISIANIPDLDGGFLLGEDILKMYNYGIMTGDSTLSFKPKSYISRAEVASIISRVANPNLRKKINAPNNIFAEYHVERPYEWFVDQNNTGTYSNDNCGPSVTSMILKWYDSANDVSAEALRAKLRPNGGWWYTDDIESILKEYQVPYKVKKFLSVSQIIDELHQNRIVMVCIDGYYISEFYDNPESGHFIIIKGYTNQNGVIRFETYNPDSRKDYYYFADNVKKAADEWWPHFYTIGN